MTSIPADPATLEQLEAALHAGGSALGARLAGAELTPVGSGAMADTFKVRLTWDVARTGPTGLIVKQPAGDSTAATTAASLGAYEREARFYSELAPRTQVRAPRLYGVIDRAGTGAPDTVLLEDLTARHRPGDQLREMPIEELDRARHQLALLQAPFWENSATAELPWLHRRLGVPIPSILERMERSWHSVTDTIAADLPADERKCIDRFVGSAADWAQLNPGPQTLVHHDLRADNLLFGEGEIVLIDWQTIGWGSAMFDYAYLIGTSLEVETRRRHEAELLRRHVADLQELGVDWTESEAQDIYRWAACAVLMMLVPPISSVKSNPRMVTMFRRMLSLGARQALDAGSLDLLDSRL
ncbi:ecdysteroid 22-kinase family protein [Gordonia paraffinivorans]|uniref:ecdysteroid 22-kinase family protein n=1 Tax=Gordonia paraffinivorans TaxID=175628 RepID=UPI0020D0C01C|nr:ecdysteroid 22-kinase family protein [Gordonia paraffinivorans]